MSAELTIRPVQPAEYGRLGELTAVAYLANHGPANPDWYLAALRDVGPRAAASCVLVAVDAGGAVLGGVTYVRGPDDPYAEELGAGDAGIRMLAVDPAAQGHGVGRALVEACLGRARADGRARVVLHTGTWMDRARRLYGRLGFRRDSSLDFQPLLDVQLLGLVLDLATTAPGREAAGRG